MFNYFKFIDTHNLDEKLKSKVFPFTQQLFWDTPVENIDLQKHKRYVIERVLTRGFTQDFYLVLKIYTTEEICNSLRKSKSLDPKTVHFCSWFLTFQNLKCMYHPSIISAATYNTLKTIFEQDIIRKHFALAGGTSLALQLQHRHSIDLDIFSPAPIDTEYLQLILSSQQDIDFRLVNSNRNMLFAFINSIKCDFIYEPSKVLHPFLVADSINYFHISDIAAMKLHTICGRGKKKDFFDIYVLLQNYSWEKLLEWFGNKYDESQFYFLWRSITYFSDADEDPEIAGIPPYNKTWEEIKAFITKSCT